MAIKINGTQVVDDSRNFTNIGNVNGVAVAPAKPAITSPIDGFQTLDSSITFQSTAFEGAVVSDDHASSDWELATDSGFTNIVASLTDSTSNLTSWTVSGLSVDTYFVRVRHSGTNIGDSEFSDAVSFSITVSIFYGWGNNSDGQLGTNSTFTEVGSPVTAVGGITDWTEVISGGDESFALRSNGVLYAWGNNSDGRLGTNDTTNRSSPVTVVGGITDWEKIDSGAAGTTLGLTKDGIIYAWGRNFLGSLGTNDTTNRSSPVTVVGGITDWVDIAAGTASYAVRSNGTLYAWGRNDNGELGTNDIIDRSSPVTVVGGITDWDKVFSDSAFALALRSDGTLYSWGRNYAGGNLGTNDTINRSSPVTVVGGITDWEIISAGGNFVVAVRSTGELYGWGTNASGQLPDTTTTNRSSPTSMGLGFTDWIDVTAGSQTFHGLRSNGELYGSGANVESTVGEGDDNPFNVTSPVTVVGGITSWTQVSGSRGQHTIALAAE